MTTVECSWPEKSASKRRGNEWRRREKRRGNEWRRREKRRREVK